MYFFLLLRQADELGINFWLRLLAVGLCASLLFQSFFYFSVINRTEPVIVQTSFSRQEEAEKGKIDVALANKVRSAIAQTKRLYPLGIAVKNRDGIITLTGEVPTDIDRELAANVAKEMPGVKEVSNEIQVITNLKNPNEESGQVNSTVNVEDLEIEANLRETFQVVPELKAQPIQIKVHHRQVTLTGRVASEQQRQRAEQLVHDAPKIITINNQLHVSH